MKKIIAVLLMTVMLCGCSKKAADSYADKEPDFRNVSWGMSIDEVKAKETTKLLDEVAYDEDNEIWLYYDKVHVANTINAELCYIFTDGKLTSTYYYATETVDGDETKGFVYTFMLESLTEVYGEPKESEKAMLSAYSKWETETTEIALYLGNDGSIEVDYTDISVTPKARMSTDGL